MKKQILAAILLAALILSLAPAAVAAGDEATNAANALHALGLFNGTGTDAEGKPIFELDRAPTRHEAVTMLVRLLGKENEALRGTWQTPFTDVAYWAEPYVGYAYAKGLTNGISGTSFGGNATVTATQYITFVLRALGYDSTADFKWDAAWDLSDALGITNGEYSAGNNGDFLRGDICIISYDALDATLKDSSVKLLDEIKKNLADSADKDLADYEAIMAEVNAEHKALVTATNSFSDISEYLVTDTASADILTDEEISLLTTSRNVKNTVTYAEAMADVDIFFRAFESAYGGYY